MTVRLNRGLERPSVVLIQTAIPHYRGQVFAHLRQALGERLTVLAGAEYFDPSVRTNDEVGGFIRVPNLFMLRRRLLWQPGVVLRAIRADVAILELNPRNLSMIATLVARRAIGKRTVLWGHAWARSGSRPISDLVRFALWRLAGVVLMYTPNQARAVARRAPTVRVHQAPNALYSRDAVQPAATDPRGFVFVGRLVEAKKPLLALEGFRAACRDLGDDARLVFAGEGPLREELEDAVASAGLRDRVEILGHVSEYETLRAVYGSVLASLSPGYVGLSLIQSLFFGVPMLIARNEPHAPEIDAAHANQNCVFFRSDSPQALGDALIGLARERDSWLARRADIAAACVDVHSVEAVVSGILAAVDDCDRRRSGRAFDGIAGETGS